MLRGSDKIIAVPVTRLATPLHAASMTLCSYGAVFDLYGLVIIFGGKKSYTQRRRKVKECDRWHNNRNRAGPDRTEPQEAPRL